MNGFHFHKQNTFTNMDGFLLALLKSLHPPLRPCFSALKFKEQFPLTARAIQWSGLYNFHKWKCFLKQSKKKKSYFFAGAVFCKFHIFNVWSSEAVIKTGSTGWKARPLIPSKWLLNVNLGFQVFLNASLLFAI